MKNISLFILVSLFCFGYSQRVIEVVNETVTPVNASNLTNTSNQSNQPEPKPFIYIPEFNPESILSSDEWDTLNKWIDYKNGVTRYDSHFDSVPAVFAPEQDYYESSITILGLPFYIIAAIIAFIGLLFCLFRYGFGLCGGSRTKTIAQISRGFRHFTFILCGIGIALWFCGMVVSLTGTMRFSDGLKNTQDSLSDEGEEIKDDTFEFNEKSKEFNNLSLTLKADDPSSILSLSIKDWENAMAESVVLNDGAYEFSDYISSNNRIFQGFLWTFFVFGFIMSGLLIYAMVRSLGGLAHVTGLVYIIFAAMAFGIAGYYYSQIFKVGDICEQNTNIINFHKPEDGTGIFKYFNCFSSNITKLIGTEKHDCSHHLNTTVTKFLELYKIYDPQNYENLKSHLDIIDLYENNKLNSTDLKNWASGISKLNTNSINLAYLSNCTGVRSYSVTSQKEYCVLGMPALYLGFVGIIIQAIAFLILVISGVQLKNILEKIKSDKESMINVRQAGGFS